MNDLHQYTRIPLGRAFALSLLITLCGLVVIEIPEMLLLPQIYADRSYYPSALQFVLDPFISEASSLLFRLQQLCHIRIAL